MLLMHMPRLALASATVFLAGFVGPVLAGEWQRFDNPAAVIGADGQLHEPSCSNYPGTDPTFRFWVRPGLSKNLVVYFEGGGACWDSASCNTTQTFNPAVSATQGPEGVGGVFDDTRRDNPVRNWTVVYVPYCTGDIHIGSADRTYNNVFGIPGIPAQFEIRHRGFDNFMVVLDWIKTNLPAPNRLLVTGASAGGYGATANFPWLAQQFPSARLSVLADASQGVSTDGWDQGTPGRGSWNPQLAPWVFGEDPLAVPGPELMRVGAQAYPLGRFSQYTTARDGVQVGFYGLIKSGYGPGNGSCSNTEADWNQQMLGSLASYDSTLRNFRYFVAPGSSHTILRSNGFYDDVGAGDSVAGWLGSQVSLRPRSNPWLDLACPDCLTPLPCP
jgi:hypothetical protein